MLRFVKESWGWAVYRGSRQLVSDRTGNLRLLTPHGRLTVEQARCMRKRGYFLAGEIKTAI